MKRESKQLFRLLEKRIAPGSDKHEIDREIWSTFGETQAILCADMSGFSERTERLGILHFLGLIQEMRTLVRPLVERWKGDLLKAEADNVLVLFREPMDAILCALQMHEATQVLNQSRVRDDFVEMCIGVGYGHILVLEDDCFGGEVNAAFRLGEDIAKSGETLLTGPAFAAIAPLEDYSFTPFRSDDPRCPPIYYRVDKRSAPQEEASR